MDGVGSGSRVLSEERSTSLSRNDKGMMSATSHLQEVVLTCMKYFPGEVGGGAKVPQGFQRRTASNF